MTTRTALNGKALSMFDDFYDRDFLVYATRDLKAYMDCIDELDVILHEEDEVAGTKYHLTDEIQEKRDKLV